MGTEEARRGTRTKWIAHEDGATTYLKTQARRQEKDERESLASSVFFCESESAGNGEFIIILSWWTEGASEQASKQQQQWAVGGGRWAVVVWEETYSRRGSLGEEGAEYGRQQQTASLNSSSRLGWYWSPSAIFPHA